MPGFGDLAGANRGIGALVGKSEKPVPSRSSGGMSGMGALVQGTRTGGIGGVAPDKKREISSRMKSSRGGRR